MTSSRWNIAIAVGLALSAGCSKRSDEARTTERSGAELPAPVPGPREVITPKDPLAAADGDMKAVLEALAATRSGAAGALTPESARARPTLADAVRAVVVEKAERTDPSSAAAVHPKTIPGPGGTLDARVYVPVVAAKSPLPVVLYFHDGLWVTGGLDAYDASARAIAREASAIVVSADHRRAPEAKFPAAHDDAVAAYSWVLANAATFGGDPRRVAVAGEGSGGNLALHVSVTARDRRLPLPVAQLLVHPVASTTMDTKSYERWGRAAVLDEASLRPFADVIVSSRDDLRDTRLDVVRADLRGLPRTSIVLAEIDPLRSEGEQLADKLEAAGVAVAKKTYEGVTHGFFGAGAVVADARAANAWAGDRLAEAFAAAAEATR